MRILKILCWTGISVFLIGTLIMAGRVETVTEKVDAQGAEYIEVECDFAAGTVNINGEDIPEAAILEVFYTPRWVDYEIDYDKAGRGGRLRLESDLLRDHVDQRLENDWDLTLSTRYPLRMNLEFGACEADFDLGGLSIEEFQLEIGATSGTIDFSQPNPSRIREMEIEVGASSLEIYNLGNANFERLSIDCGAASCEIDFHGEFQGEAEVQLDVGIGSVDVIMPRGLAIRVETDDDSWFSSIDFHGLRLNKLEDGLYESSNFDDAEDRLVFSVDVGMGSVDFRAKK